MMKPKVLLLFTLFIGHSVFSAEAKKAEPLKQVYAGVAIREDSTLKKLLSIPEVAAQYESCQSKFKGANNLDKIPNCLWNGDGENIRPLSQGQKDQIKKINEQEESGELSKSKKTISDADAEVDANAAKRLSGSSYTTRSVNIGIDYKSDPTVKALSAFFGKKLDEALNGTEKDRKEKKILAVDHKKYIDLYTSELGKSIVNSFTSYCMETDPACRIPTKDKDGKLGYNTTCIISSSEEQRKKDIAANLKTLNQSEFTEAEGTPWTYCIGNVTNVCYDNLISSDDTDDEKNDKSYSKQKACLVMDFVKSARKNLIIAKDQKEFYDGLQGGGDRAIASIADNMKALDEKESSADKLTQITSADIAKDFKNNDNQTENIAKTNEQLIGEAKDCVGDDGLITTQDKCKKFLDTDTKKNTDAVNEFGIRQFAKADTLSDELKSDKNVNSYLLEEGYSKEQIKDLTSSEKSLEEIRQKIKDRFKNEKDAIIKEMASKIAGKTAVTDGSIQTGDVTTIQKIKTDLASRNDDLKNLIHFNNIVASYLNISESDGKSNKLSRNTSSLYAEVGSMDKKDSADINERIKKNKDLKENPTTADFQVNDINQILKYNGEQKSPDAKNP